jgi:transcriptional regulator with XRE-family HTH domain
MDLRKPDRSRRMTAFLVAPDSPAEQRRIRQLRSSCLVPAGARGLLPLRGRRTPRTIQSSRHRSTTYQVVMITITSFPARLVWWRKRRGLSQLQLAMAAACSQRHISFLELGRTKPSREMVLRLSATLDVPLRQSNELLLTAGYAPVWAETDLSAQALAPIREALNYILAHQEPFPAVVVDRRWNLRQANKGAIAMVEFLVGALKPGTAINLADAPRCSRRAKT